jgi:hypothetical protein
MWQETLFQRHTCQDKDLAEYRASDISMALCRMISYNIGQVQASFIHEGLYALQYTSMDCKSDPQFGVAASNVVITNQDSTSSRLLPGSSYSCCIRNLHVN